MEITALRYFALLLVVLCPLVVCADDWPEFRGPTGQGHYEGKLPVHWGPNKNITWKQDIPGKGWSSPVICKERIFLTTGVPLMDEDKTLSLRVLCLDTEKGKVLWNKEVLTWPGAQVPRHHKKNSNASPTPIIEGNRLYVHFGHLGTACLDLDGKILWRQTKLKYRPVHGNGGSPALVDDLLIYSMDGGDKQLVVALDKNTGKVKWKTDRKSTARKKFSFGTPLVIEVNEQKQVISTGSDMVAAYDVQTGKEIWRLRYEGYSLIPRPVFGHGMVFLSTCYDSPTLLAIKVGGSGDVTESHLVWDRALGAPHAPSPLLVGNELYTVSDRGIAGCADAKTGQVHWTKRLNGGFSASPLFAAGKIYFQSEGGVGYVVQAGTEFKLLATNDMEERTLASYAASDGAIFLRTAEHLYRIDER